jgi:amino acid adenylation domain-containing protein/non-ribosomal peptide synthase protein (TIGR01720 family)
MKITHELDNLLCELLHSQLQKLDSDATAALRAPYDRWFAQSLAMMESNGRTHTPPTNVDDTWQRWDRSKGPWLEDPDTRAAVTLLETTLKALPDILTGKRLATDVIFPQGSMALVEGVYQRNRVADSFNEVLADTVVAYLDQRLKQEPSARLKILEIGAGTGGTSAVVLSKLEPYQDHIEEYCYTDISKAFLIHAERQYCPHYPFLNTRIFDVQASAVEQGFDAGGYDLVLAANVLHATKNIRDTLRNVKQALRTNGLILLNEITGTSLFVHLTFGLLEGWWMYEDGPLRAPGSPGLTPETWERVLISEGFRSVFFPAQSSHELGQQIVIAESNGVVRSRRSEAVQNTAGARAIDSPPPKISKPTRTKAISEVDVTDQMVEEHVRETVIENLSQSLQVRIDLIDSEESFGDYGLDSITGINFLQVLNQALDITLQNTDLFDHSSVDQLTAYILSAYQDRLAASLSHIPSQNGTTVVQEPPHPSQVAPREKAATRVPPVEPAYQGGIAIIGMSGRFAGAESVDELWQHLANGTDLIEDDPRWEIPDRQGQPNYGSFLKNIESFDPFFFKISGVEARYMDPQQRLFLEESWKALEDAGYAGESIRGRQCGVFVGCHAGDYHQLFEEAPPPQAFWGNASSVVPARIAYHLNLQGPAVAIDTACSSSLTAIHLACQGLRAGEMEMAVSGGVFVQSTPGAYLASSRAGMLSKRGRCFTFDERADGFVFGEGVGVVVLRRLDEALAAGDHIYGVIRGSGMNQDGTTSGITAPSSESQARLERQVYDTCNLNPEQIQMVEAHGTATQLGDPIEFEALTRAFRSYTDRSGYCAIGSIKTNIGHTSAAAGVAGLIKILLALKHQKIPASLHHRTGNANIRIKESPFYVNTRLRDWNVEPESTRCAALSSFGFSGTNTHMVIEQAPTVVLQRSDRPGHLIVLSARTSEQLKQRVEDLVAACDRHPQLDLGDISHTLLLGRRHFSHRLACVVRRGEELISKLRSWLKKGKTSSVLVSSLQQRDRPEQSSLKRYGNQCIAQCRQGTPAKDVLENLCAIAELYAQGYQLSYEELFADRTYARISLPTYPFAKVRCWVDESKPTPAAVTALAHRAKPATSQQPFELMTFEEVWQEQAAPAAPSKTGTLVFFLSDPQQQQTVLNTVPGQCVFLSLNAVEPSKGVYSLTDTDRGSFETAFRKIGDDHGEVEALLYLWPLEDPSYIRDFACIVSILQGLASSGLRTGRLLLAGQFINELERSYLESWIGFERSLGLVLPQTRVASVLGSEQALNDWLPRLLAELSVARAESVLYQQQMRHVCRIRPTKLSSGCSVSKPGGTYLITGGCGGLGLLFAEHLAKKHPVNLILTGRSTPDQKKRAKIQALEDLGSRVYYLKADLCDDHAMAQGLSEAKEDFGAVCGVIHAAGIHGGATLFERDISSFQEVLSAKIKGTRLLDELLAKEPLDFVCYFSSAAAILGDFGSCDYAVGNRFQMAYARHRTGPGRTLAINWPTWRDGGMGDAEHESTAMYLRSSGQRLLENDEGVAVFDKMMAGDLSQQLVLVGQPERVHQFLGRVQGEASPVNPTALPSGGKGRRREMRGFSVEQCLEWDLKEQVATLLGVPRDQLDLESNLAEFGFDSISLADFAGVLSEYYAISITPSVFFGHSSLGQLTQYILNEHACVQEFYQEQTSEPAAQAPKAPDPVMEAEPPKPLITTLHAEPGSQPEPDEPIAIIGMSGRFPDCRNIDEMWQYLVQGQNAVRDFPEERFYPGSPRPQGGARWRCGCVPGVAEFDPTFFEMSPRDAERMDPRQRLLLQESWKALEDAGYGPKQIEGGRIGVYVGVEQGDFQALSDGGLTSSHDAVLASRLAYFLDLSGPVLAINTACSSGLVAAHQACQSLRNQECDTAIAAGVNLMLTPDAYEGMSRAGMLSEDGTCFAFDVRANGMVPGEAVAVVVLKRLAQARADGDPIYAVLKGSGVNYDGKTNGITAPSGMAQTRLLQTVYDRYRVNPEDIDYIVTHGTGTRLGDPIEINALYDAFKDRTDKTRFCALTSSKTNFGHTFAASGLLSLISLVQAMRHETIPASLHCEQENDYINWERSPFYVNKANKPWPRSKHRTGAVSAFGVSGTNVHLVVESDDRAVPGPVDEQAPFYLLCLSAKTREALQEKVEDSLTALQGSGQSLAHMSHTLLEGRAHFAHRCAVVVQDRADAVHVLQQTQRKERLPNLFRATVPRGFTGQKAMQRYVLDLVQQTHSCQDDRNGYQEILLALAELYCQGYEIPSCHIELLQRIHLPTYPFSRQRYWISEEPSSVVVEQKESMLHPLLHRNTSDFSEQRFSSIFTGSEFFLADHVVGDLKLLPAVATLEMARAAVELATGESGTGIQLNNVVWPSPIAVKDLAVRIHIGLFPEKDGKIAYEIYSNDETPVVHSRGSAVIGAAPGTSRSDLKALQAECSLRRVNATECYELFTTLGLNYGPGLQGIETIHVGSGLVLAKLSVPSSLSESAKPYVLHPSLMDSALQASIGFFMTSGAAKGPAAIPFALQQLEIHRPCQPSMWAVIRSEETAEGRKLDLDLCDDQGSICVRMKGFLSRVPGGESSADHATLLFEPHWKSSPNFEITEVPDYAQHIVMLCGQQDVSSNELEQRFHGSRCLNLESDQDSVDARFESCAIQAFQEIQSLLRSKPEGRVLCQIVVSIGDEQLFSGLTGMLKTARLESPKFVGQLVAVGPGEPIAERLTYEMRCPSDSQIRYLNGERQVRKWREVEAAPNISWRDQGVYLITGGAGGLGRLVARDIDLRTEQATVILTGRSQLDESRLEGFRGNVVYRQVDASDERAVSDLIRDIRDEFGELHGIFHSAGVLRDNFILNKTHEELRLVLAPKVAGLVNLDRATSGLPLDFFALFSSASAALGSVGQADYATANAFMDAYAAHRNSQAGSRRFVSVNWPLWKDGGMSVDESTEKMMRRKTGLIPMPTDSGLKALWNALALTSDQVMVLTGDAARIRAFANPPTQEPEATPRPKGTCDPDRVERLLIQSVAQLMKFSPEDLDAESELSEYGFDSISLTELANVLNQELDLDLAPTIFFEHTTIESLAKFLVETYPEAFSQSDPAPAASNTVPCEAPAPINRARATRRSRVVHQDLPTVTEPIAVVGMSCKFPMADGADEFWANLTEGKICIQEIPASRWDWRESYGDPEKEQNKTRIKWGGFIEGVENFDPLFFGISPREAELMDPQQRLLLTQVWLASEDAGIPPQTLSQCPTGVFIAAGPGEYMHAAGLPANTPMSMTAVAASVIPNRISYAFNLRGPSEYCETACSSAIVALHRAMQSIRQGECEQAIVGAVNLLLSPIGFIGLDAMGYLSPDGQSRSFQSGANGYVRSEGVGVVILKPLQKAKDDGDNIYALVRGTGVCHGGKGLSLTAPNATGMKAAMTRAFQVAQVDPRTVSYIEAHGISSPLGDGIELNALRSGYQDLAAGDLAESTCTVGSLKPSIGHGELVSGMASLIKAILALKNRVIPSITDFTEPNENIKLTGSHLNFASENRPWEAQTAHPRRAAVNSYGFGGVNAHVVLEEWEDTTSRVPPTSTPQIVVLSARTQDRLQAITRRMIEFLQRPESPCLSDLAYTLQVGREAMECRLALVVNDLDELSQGLNQYLAGATSRIPVFSGDSSDDRSDIRALLSGKAGEAVIKSFLAENEIEKLAFHWTQGGVIPWPALHLDQDVRKIALPSYPFVKERYWLSPDSHDNRGPRDSVREGGANRDDLLAYLIKFLSDELKIPSERINVRKHFQDYGVDSIVGLSLMRDVAEVFGCKVSGRDLLEHPTLESLAGHLAESATTDQTALESLPLSEGPRGLWMLQTLHPRMSAFNVPMALRIPQEIDTATFQRACELAFAQHTLPRAVVSEDEGTPVLTFRKQNSLFFRRQDIAHLEEHEVLTHLRELADEPFDLKTGPLLRIHLLGRSKRESILLVCMHHIVCDGRSLVLLVDTLREAYTALHRGRPPASPPVRASFGDFVDWEKNLLASAEGRGHLAYWTEQLSSGELPVLRLRADHLRPDVRSFRGQTHQRLLSKAVTKQIREQARALRVQVPVYLLGVFKALLYRYTGDQDIIVGMPTIGRPQRRFEDVVGYFVNVVPIRSRLTGEHSFRDLLKELQLTVADGLDHAAYPFPALVRQLNIPRDKATAPVYQVSYTYQNLIRPAELTNATDLEMVPIPEVGQQGDDEFGLEVSEAQEQLLLTMAFDPDIFELATVESMMEHYSRLLRSAIETPERRISEIPMLTDPEVTVVCEAESTLRLADSLPSLLERHPDQMVALKCQDQQLSYGELLQGAERVARAVRGATRVAVVMPRSLDVPVALLGILMSGATFVVVDPELPPARRQTLLAGADRILHRLPTTSGGHWLPPVHPDASAYIVYTSGSTGEPKGVVVSHGQLASHCLSMAEQYELTPADTVLQFASFAFDVALEQLFTALIAGARVVMRPDELWTPARCLEVMQEEGVTVADLPPDYFAELVDDWRPLRLLLLGGDLFPSGAFARLREGDSSTRVLNAYGPTEGTITATFHEASGSGPQPIGLPVAGRRIYILNEHLQAVPRGAPGELCIGGFGVARGYLDAPGETALRFVPNPFERGRLYRTGDRARLLCDGSIEFLGRLDRELKVRGYRVAPEEVEQVLLAHPKVGTARVELDAGQLVARVDTEADLRDYLEARLPRYMVPRLPGCTENLEYQPPATATERLLAELWEEALGLNQVGRQDNFFHRGGDSILAMRVVARAQAQGLGLEARDFFRYQTLAELADHAREARVLAQHHEPKGEVPLTPIQHWFFELNLTRPQHHNLALLIKTEPGMDPERLEAAVAQIAAHHDALRYTFQNGQQVCQPKVAPGALEIHAEWDAGHLERLHSSFDLERGPLFRVAWFERPGRLFLAVHHLVVDGVSLRILMEDLAAAYNGESLLRSSPYASWSRRLEEVARSKTLESEIESWAELCRHTAPLPVDVESSGPVTVATSDLIVCELNSRETGALQRLGTEAALLGTLSEVLCDWTGGDGILIERDTHGRDHGLAPELDLSRTVGWFTAPHPLYIPRGKNPVTTGTEALQRVPEMRQSYGILRTMARSEIQKSIRSLPQPQVSFNFLGQFDSSARSGPFLGLAPEGQGSGWAADQVCLYPLEVIAEIRDGALRVYWNYNRRLNHRETVERLAKAHTERLQNLLVSTS